MTEATAPASPFDALLAEIGAVGELAKSLPAEGEGGECAAEGDDDAKIAEAAAEGDAATPPAGGDEKPEGELGKSFEVKFEDGTVGEAVDATELLKALITRVEGGEVKSVEAITSVLGVVKAQGELIKSLQDKVSKFGNSAPPRKAVVTVAEKTPAAAAAVAEAPAGISVDEFWGKCFAAQADGALNSTDITKLEFALNHNQQPQADILARIVRWEAGRKAA